MRLKHHESNFMGGKENVVRVNGKSKFFIFKDHFFTRFILNSTSDNIMKKATSVIKNQSPLVKGKSDDLLSVIS